VTVRRMSAHQAKILAISSAVQNTQINDRACFQGGTSSPKAEVGGSNPLGRANYFSDL
jgi:hypothetical protein